MVTMIEGRFVTRFLADLLALHECRCGCRAWVALAREGEANTAGDFRVPHPTIDAEFENADAVCCLDRRVARCASRRV